MTIECTANYGGLPRRPSATAPPCSVEGLQLNVSTNEIPQNGGCKISANCLFPGTKTAIDAHMGVIDTVAGYEYWFHNVEWPPQNGVLNINWGGRCLLSGDGFSDPSYSGPSYYAGCSGDASTTPGSLGLISVASLQYAADNGSVLPTALGVTLPCPEATVGPLPSPFLTSGDGACSGVPPEGTRFYINETDAQINAGNQYKPLVAAILRTMDKQHYGAFIIDSSCNSPCSDATIAINFVSDDSFTSWNLPGPIMHSLLPQAQAESIASPPAQDGYGTRTPISFPMPAAIPWSMINFCENANCS